MSIVFDTFGNPTPYEKIPISYAECEKFFTSIINKDVRGKRWKEFDKFNNDLSEKLSHPFYQWVDGSFTTTKQEPRDIDVVTFVNYLDFKPELLLFDMNRTQGAVKAVYNVDSYLVFVVPSDHKNYLDYMDQIAYWTKQFGHDRQKNKKGRIEVHHD